MATSIKIRRGTSKTFILSTKNSERTWSDLGTLIVRIAQENTVIDKLIVPIETDPTKARVSYTQEDTIKLAEKKPFKMQIFSILGPSDTEIAVKSDIYNGIVLPSLWNEVVHND